MSLGQLYNDFSDRTFNLDFIFRYYKNKIYGLYADIISRFDYNIVDITHKTIDTIKSINDPIEFSTKLYKIVGNKAVGYSANKINMIYVGSDPENLINIIPSSVFSDEFFIRFFSKVNYIHDNFPHDKYNFITLMTLLYPLGSLKDKLFPSYIIGSNRFDNLFNRMFFPVEKNIREDYQNKSSYLSLILTSFISYYLKYSNNYIGVISSKDPSNFVSKNLMLNSFKLFINNNIDEISNDMYRYIVNTIMSFTRETQEFKIDIKHEIVNDVLNNNILIDFVKFKDIDFTILISLFRDLHVYYSYLVTENILYNDTRYNSDIIDVDLIKLLDIERYVLSRLHKDFIYDFSTYIKSIQYFSIKFKREQLFFLNTIAFLHHYFISNLIYDKKISPLTSLFNVFYNDDNFTKFIMSSISFINNVNIDSNIKDVMINYLNNDIMKVIMLDHLIAPIYRYVDSEHFIRFIVDLVSGVYSNVNEFYYYINTSFEFLEKIKMFFKLMVLNSYFSSTLFDGIISEVRSLIASVIEKSLFGRDIGTMYEEFSKYSRRQVYNLISSYSFSGVYVHYLYWTFLEPLLI
ncbi:MAG: hypothetical protein QXD03_03675 [Candidatus Anstonellales archaeon]